MTGGGGFVNALRPTPSNRQKNRPTVVAQALRSFGHRAVSAKNPLRHQMLRHAALHKMTWAAISIRMGIASGKFKLSSHAAKEVPRATRTVRASSRPQHASSPARTLLLNSHEHPKSMTDEFPKEHSIARERILDAAYELFAAHGVEAVGVDAIVARSGTGKMTLYRHFKSKEALILAFLKRRREMWTRDWLLARISKDTDTPSDGLLAFFEVYQEWFLEPDFDGCPFVNTLVEARNSDSVRHAAAEYLSEIRSAIETRARCAGLVDVERLARAWNTLLMGAILSRLSGQLDAAREAQATARTLLVSWPRMPTRI